MSLKNLFPWALLLLILLLTIIIIIATNHKITYYVASPQTMPDSCVIKLRLIAASEAGFDPSLIGVERAWLYVPGKNSCFTYYFTTSSLAWSRAASSLGFLNIFEYEDVCGEEFFFLEEPIMILRHEDLMDFPTASSIMLYESVDKKIRCYTAIDSNNILHAVLLYNVFTLNYNEACFDKKRISLDRIRSSARTDW